MSSLVLPNTITAGEPMAAAEVQLNFEAIRTLINGGIEDDNLAAAAKNLFLQLNVGGVQRKVAFGYQALTFAASANSDAPAVTHGLGAVPVLILATGGTGAGGKPIAVSFESFGAATFALRGRVVDGTALTATTDTFWLAIA